MPPSVSQYFPLISLVVSLLALLLSGVSLGWSMYRELALRGRLKVDFGVKEIYGVDRDKPLTRVIISATNFGPGSVNVNMIVWHVAPLWRRILRRTHGGVIIFDYTDPLSARLPKKMEVGETINLTLKYGPEFKLNLETSHIGLIDSFGKSHWAPMSDIRRFRKQYEKDFPSKSS